MQKQRLLLLLFAGLCFVVLLSFSSTIPKARRCKMTAYFRQDRSCEDLPAVADLPAEVDMEEEREARHSLTPTPPNCNSSHPFPKVVHLIWKEREVPPGLQPFVSSWSKHNSDWEVKVWDDGAVAKLLKQRLSPSKFEQWENFPSTVGKMDVARLYLMQLLGGVYSDLDMMCYSCLNALLAQQAPQVTLVLPKEYEGGQSYSKEEGLISNFWIASLPNASAIRFLVDSLPSKVDGRWQWPDTKAFAGQDPDPNHDQNNGILNTAGPRFIQKRVFTAPPDLAKDIAILPGKVWASIFKEKLWENPHMAWQDQDPLKESIAKFESFGLHFHAGGWWHGPAQHKFYNKDG